MLIEPSELNDYSVLDIGCGTGDLLAYLISKNIGGILCCMEGYKLYLWGY